SRPDPLAAVAAARGAATGDSEEARPNAAETAASIREFLRGDPAGADPAGAVPADPTAAEAAGAAPDPTAAEAAGTGPADPAPAAHPNAGAAGFGRPISEVLSA